MSLWAFVSLGHATQAVFQSWKWEMCFTLPWGCFCSEQGWLVPWVEDELGLSICSSPLKSDSR